MTNTKQMKITKIFRRGAKLPEDCDELQEEIQQLEQRLKEKQDELFNLQRNSYRRKTELVPTKKNEPFIRPQKMSIMTSVESLKRELQLMSRQTGIEVQSYVVDDHCCITFSMQHDADHQVKHGLRIELKSGVNEISKSSLPLGFNLQAIIDEYDNKLMIPECLGAIKKALIAYYDRQEQFETLKKMLNIEAQLFKMLDATHIQIAFVGQNERDEDAESVNIVLMLDYRIYDIRPKYISFKETDLPEGVAGVLAEQCTTFKRKPLPKAFKEAFLDGIGPYQLVKKLAPQISGQPAGARRQRTRPDAHYYRNDDTFRPDDCPYATDESDDD